MTENDLCILHVFRKQLMEPNKTGDLRKFMEGWHEKRDPRGDTVHRCGDGAWENCRSYGHGYVLRDLSPEEDVYRLTEFSHFITAIHVTMRENVTLNVTVTYMGCYFPNQMSNILLLDLGKISLTEGENRLPFVGRVKPLVNCGFCVYISFFRDTDEHRYTPTKVTSTGLIMSNFSNYLHMLKIGYVLRMTPSTKFVFADGYMSIRQSEKGAWMRYGAFLWLLRKHYRDIMHRLYRPGGFMAKRMERSIYGN